MKNPPKKARYIAFFLCLSFAINHAFGQSNYFLTEDNSLQGNFEFGIQVGSNNFLGDLGGNIGKGSDFIKDYTLKTVRPLFGVSLNYYPLYWLNIIGGVNITKVTGADSLITNENGAERWRYNRNLSFRSPITEGYIGAEILILPLIDRSFASKRFNPYLGVGVGVFHFNPQTMYKGRWVDLKPLSLEGQGFAEYPDRKEYSLTQIYFPFTAGLRYIINDNLNLSSGFIFRHTNTDYIDDVGTTYIDPALFDKYLSKTDAALAKELYSRSKTPWKVKPGIDRADRDGNKKDSYVSFFITLRLALSRNPQYFGCWRN